MTELDLEDAIAGLILQSGLPVEIVAATLALMADRYREEVRALEDGDA